MHFWNPRVRETTTVDLFTVRSLSWEPWVKSWTTTSPKSRESSMSIWRRPMSLWITPVKNAKTIDKDWSTWTLFRARARSVLTWKEALKARTSTQEPSAAVFLSLACIKLWTSHREVAGSSRKRHSTTCRNLRSLLTKIRSKTCIKPSSHTTQKALRMISTIEPVPSSSPTNTAWLWNRRTRPK